MLPAGAHRLVAHVVGGDLGPDVGRVDGGGLAVDDETVDAVLHERSRVRLPEEALGVGFVLREQQFGTAVGSPAIYGVIAMGAVFAAAAQAPLTALASVVEMTGNYTLTLPVMLAVGLD